MQPRSQYKRKAQGGTGFSGQIVGLNPVYLDNYKTRVNVKEPIDKQRMEQSKLLFESKKTYNK